MITGTKPKPFATSPPVATLPKGRRHRSEPLNASPNTMCMAILEYYAFEAGGYETEQARHSFRRLARKSFRNFIYQQCGYNPANGMPSLWQPFHDRASLPHNTVSEGYVGIFHAIHALFTTLGQNGIHTDQSFVPDISVDMA